MQDTFGIPETLSSAIFSAQLELRGAFRDSLRVGVRLGHLLTQAKAACRHGEFGGWLKTHFDGSIREAQRFMELAREYPNPDDVPSLSLREALRLIRGKRRRQPEKHFAHERLSPATIQTLLAMLMTMDEFCDENIITSLEVEGVTSQHAAMKRAKTIKSDVRRFIEYLRADFRAHEQSGGGAQDVMQAEPEGVDGENDISIPKLSPDRVLFGTDLDGDSLVEVWPSTRHPGCYHIGVSRGLSAAVTAYCDYNTRPCRLHQQSLVSDIEKMCGVKPAVWRSEPVDGRAPWFLEPEIVGEEAMA